MGVTGALPQGQTPHSRCRFSVEVYPEAVTKSHPLTENRTTKGTAVTARFMITLRAHYLDDGDLPAFLKSSLILVFCFRQQVLQDVLTEGKNAVASERRLK